MCRISISEYLESLYIQLIAFVGVVAQGSHWPHTCDGKIAGWTEWIIGTAPGHRVFLFLQPMDLIIVDSKHSSEKWTSQTTADFSKAWKNLEVDLNNPLTANPDVIESNWIHLYRNNYNFGKHTSWPWWKCTFCWMKWDCKRVVCEQQ